MTRDEHEAFAALESENADLRSEVSRLRDIAAERDALADEVAVLTWRIAEKVRFGRDAAARVAELEEAARNPRTLSRDEVAALMKEGEKIGAELEARFTRMERPDPNAKDRAR